MKAVFDFTPTLFENVRTPERWNAIWRHFDFYGASVLDIGCHTGEMIHRAWHAGAKNIVGVDRSAESIKIAEEYNPQYPPYGPPWIRFWHYEVVPTAAYAPTGYDVGLMLSVIGYMIKERGLKAVTDMLESLSMQIPVMFIEPHFEGDGPGNFYAQQDVQEWFESIWNDVRVIATLDIPGRDATRSIWRCSQADRLIGREPMGADVYRIDDNRVIKYTNKQRPQWQLENEFRLLRRLKAPYFPKALEIDDNKYDPIFRKFLFLQLLKELNVEIQESPIEWQKKIIIVKQE